MNVEQCMCEQVITVEPDACLSDAARLLCDEEIGALPVTIGGRVIGVLSEGDLVRSIADGVDQSIASVSDYASRAVIAVGPATPVEEAQQLMVATDVRHLLVVDRGYLIGIVSVRDLLRHERPVANRVSVE